MPNTYLRKTNATPRGLWTSNNLQSAIDAVTSGIMGVNEAARNFSIPQTTLKRRIKSNNTVKLDRLGPDSLLGAEAETKLAAHIKKLQKYGFSPTRQEVREMAYKLANQLGIKNKFNQDEGKAGKKWLASFLRRRSDIVVRKAENVSLARTRGMSKDIVQRYFEQLEQILTDNSLFDKPQNIFNCDETGLQLNTRAGHVLAEKGSKCVPSISPGEKGETISILSCCNAEGTYLPPYCIFKGKNRKDEWYDGMPPGSHIRMSEKSAYVNSDIFLDWLQNHFFPRKPSGTVLLILDGHTSHTTNLDTLQFAENHEIILFCLPAHTTHYLQPLDRSFFKSLKGYFYDGCRYFIRNQPNRKLNRLQFGKLLGDAWGKAATVHNALSGFKCTGIMPFNPAAIPEHAFLMQAMSNTERTQRADSPEAGPSGLQDVQNRTPKKTTMDITPGKALDMVSPVPVIETPAVKKARRQLTGVLSSNKCSATKRIIKKSEKKKRGKKQKRLSSSSESEEIGMDVENTEEEREQLSDNEYECVGCAENYRKTKKKDDWIQCVLCKLWMHEGCTTYENVCEPCGMIIMKKK